MPKCTWSDEPNLKIMLNLTPDWISIQQLTMTTKSSYSFLDIFNTNIAWKSAGLNFTVLRASWFRVQMMDKTMCRENTLTLAGHSDRKRNKHKKVSGTSDMGTVVTFVTANLFCCPATQLSTPKLTGRKTRHTLSLGLGRYGGLAWTWRRRLGWVVRVGLL